LARHHRNWARRLSDLRSTVRISLSSPPAASTMTESIDRLYATPREDITGFRFDESVVAIFPDMIKRSVPGYSTIIHMIGQIAERYAQADTRLYDLGCSLGAATLAMRHRINAHGTRIIAVDNSLAMTEHCRTVLEADSGEVPVELICADIQDVAVDNASVCVLNFTLQFIPLEHRAEVLRRVAQGTVPGGVLILSEKIAFEDPEHQQLMTELHHNFKRANGYSDLEIAQKRTALENVLIPETLKTHQQRLLSAGFRSVDCWFQCFNFASLIAFK
jgi:methyltransferase, putative